MAGQDLTPGRKKLLNLLTGELPVLRARIGISQEELADRIGISRQTYSRIETGKREMTWTMFVALDAFFEKNEQTRQMLNHIEGFCRDVDNELRL